LFPHISRAGAWFLHSGIQQSEGGVARYYRADLTRNNPVSTEITGYTASAFVFLHTLTQDARYLDRATVAARFLVRTWDPASRTLPFEADPPAFTYFFDCGIIIRGLLAVWRATGEQPFLDVAAELGRSLAADFASPSGDFHPILSLPDKRPTARDPLRWSQSAGCYQLKAALAWWDLSEATGDERFREPYLRVLEYSLHNYAAFLPGHPERDKVMDRLHAFLYFLEGLLPRVDDRRCAAALCDGIRRTAGYVRDIAPEFARSDVYAQLLRIRHFAGQAGVAPFDREAASFEAARLSEFQAADDDPRIDGGYWFGRRGQTWLPYVNPVSTAFSMQALAMWEGDAPPDRHLLI
jgi:hypothetical protein